MAARSPTFLEPPRVCGDEAERLEWAASSTFRLTDDVAFGVRYSDAALQAPLEAALANRLMPPQDSPGYFSLRLGAAGRRQATPLHYLYVGGRVVLATRDVTRLFHAIIRHVHDWGEPEEHLMRPAAVAVQTPDGRTLLVPDSITLMVKPLEKQLIKRGFRFADAPRATLDPAGPALVVPEPTDVDWNAISRERLADLAPSVEEPTIAFGRYPLDGWLVSVAPDEAAEQLRPALAVATIARLIGPPFPLGAKPTLDALTAIVRTAKVSGVTWSTPDELVGQVAATAALGADA